MALNNLTRIGNSGFGTDTSINTTGIVTAASFSGDGSGLTGVTAVGSGVVVREEGSNVGTAQTINFIGTGVTATISGGIASIEIATSGGGGGGGLSDVVSDTTPQLGGNLDLNSKNITGTGDISITGDATFSGDLDVDGHVDLDNVSIAGVSTFNAIRLGDGNDGSTNNIKLGADNDLKIYHSGTHAFMQNGTGNVYLRSSSGTSINIEPAAGASGIIANAQGNVELYHNNSKKFETTSTGAIVTGTLVATATTATNVTVANEASDTECFVMFGVNATGDNAPKSSSSLKYNSSSGGLTAGSFIGDGSGLTGITASGSGVIVRDDGSLVGTAGTIDFGTNVSVSPISAGVVTVTASAGSIPGINTSLTTQLNNLTVAGVSTFNNNVKFDSAGAHIEFTPSSASATSQYMKFWVGNNSGTHYATLDGSSGAFQIFNTSHPTGTLDFRAKEDFSFQVNGYYSILNQSSGGVKLYHPGSQGNILSQKFETLGAGVTVTGTTFSNQLNVSGIATATTFSGSGASLTTLNASELDSGTIPDARFPATLPAVSGANLTNLPSDTPADTDVQVTYDVSSNGSSGYRFTGPGYSGADDNPDIYLVRGQRYRFINGTGSGHPFRIQSDTSGTAYTDGVSGSQSGTQDFNVQHDAPVRLYYQCTIHSGMIGNIYIVGASDWRMTDVATNATPEIYTNLNVGIGTDNPSKRFHVADYGTHGAIRIEGSGNGNRSGIEFYRETSAGVSKGGAAIWVESDTSSSVGKLRFGTASNAAIQSQSTRMILDNNGQLGIGVTDPSEKLHIDQGNIVIGQNSGASTNNRNYIKFGKVSAPKAAIGFINISGNGRGDIIFMNNNVSDSQAFSDSDEKLRIRSDGGICFNGDTTQANALDDYEEGTWTPVYRGAGTAGTYTYGDQIGVYTKIGRSVHVTLRLTNITEVAAASGAIRISGLPFASDASMTGGNMRLDQFDLGSNTRNLAFIVGSASDYLSIYQTNDDAGDSALNESARKFNTSDLIGSFTYNTTT